MLEAEGGWGKYPKLGEVSQTKVRVRVEQEKTHAQK